MSNSKKLATAALAGLLAVGVMSTNVAQAGAHEQEKSGSMDQEKEKHACKGQNGCKGQGADGKNACKGQGSCATDGSHPDK
jgi:hypothetical protein